MFRVRLALVLTGLLFTTVAYTTDDPLTLLIVKLAAMPFVLEYSIGVFERASIRAGGSGAGILVRPLLYGATIFLAVASTNIAIAMPVTPLWWVLSVLSTIVSAEVFTRFCRLLVCGATASAARA